jgi:hypothetical protein
MWKKLDEPLINSLLKLIEKSVCKKKRREDVYDGFDGFERFSFRILDMMMR